MGGREEISQILPFAPLTPKQQGLLGLLADPKRAKDSLAKLCGEAEILPGELLELLRNASMARSLAASFKVMADGLPAVTEDVLDKATDAVVDCPECFKTGAVADDAVCPRCHGRGEILRPSDFARQKLLGDWAGLTPQKSGVNVQVGVNQNVGIPLPGGFFSNLVKATDHSAYDVSVTEVPTPHDENGRPAPETPPRIEGEVSLPEQRDPGAAARDHGADHPPLSERPEVPGEKD
jgi:hypothetical protein